MSEFNADCDARRRFVSGLAASVTAGALVSVATASKNASAATLSYVTPQDYGALGNGTADDTAAVQNAVNALALSSTQRTLYVPDGTYKLTAPISITRGISILGEGCEPYKDLVTSKRGNGSWFHIAHAGVGFNIKPVVAPDPAPHDLSGFEMRGIGIYRDQPVPGGGAFTPTNNDWDIYISNADVLLDDLMLLNPTKGIFVTNATASQPNVLNPFSRITINNIRGQPLTYGLMIENAQDVARISNIHWWPFWVLSPKVVDWQQANLVGIHLARCDGPLLTNVFSWSTHAGLKIVGGVNGTTYRMQVANAYFDNTHTGIHIDSSANGVTSQMANVTMQGAYPYAPINTGIQIDGSNCRLDFTNLSSAAFNANCISVNGSGNLVNVTNMNASLYDGSGVGNPAIVVNGQNSLFVTGLSAIEYVATAKWFGGTGNISCFLGSGSVSTTTDAAGFAGISPNPSLRCDPRKVFIQVTGTFAPAMTTVDMLTAGFIRTRFFLPSGAIMANTAVTFHWRAEY